MLKFGGEAVRHAVLDMCNAIIKPGSPTNTQWKHTVMKVFFKDGGPTRPSNYRPICTLPALYKLFARLLYQRLDMYLGPEQSCDQAGFRKGFSTIDHKFTMSCIQEKADEFQQTVWNCALDFKKAFDTVEHGSLWEALRGQGVPE
eukprot:7758732-Pyramimonas_sp.AAC.1